MLEFPIFGQSSMTSEGAELRLPSVAESAICSESMPANAAKAALRLVCLRNSWGIRNMAIEKAIIIGFVGGFARSDDTKHPEVQFAALIREAYPSAVHAEVFSNHDGKRALRRVLQLLSEDGNGVPTSLEKEKARVIILWPQLGRFAGGDVGPRLAPAEHSSFPHDLCTQRPQARSRRCSNSVQRSEFRQLLPDKRPHSWSGAHSRV